MPPATTLPDRGVFTETYLPPPIGGDYHQKHVVTVDQFTRPDLELLFRAARTLKRRMRTGDRGLSHIAAGRVLGLLFFEASTRTDLSFQAAMRRLGGVTIGASNGIEFSSVHKGENLADTVRAAGCYADAIILRHPQVGASFFAARYLDLLGEQLGRRPVVISAGDGTGEHPTQALLDLFTILDERPSIDGATVTMVGDLKHGRTVHSLAKLLAVHQAPGLTVACVSPGELRMPADIIGLLRDRNVRTVETDTLENVIGVSDVIYWTRVQQERFADIGEYRRIARRFVLTPGVFAGAPPACVLMHPLPRKHEMGDRHDRDRLDADPRAAYFRQMQNGMLVRMALLALVLQNAHI